VNGIQKPVNTNNNFSAAAFCSLRSGSIFATASLH